MPFSTNDLASLIGPKLAQEIIKNNPNPDAQDFTILAAAYAESGEFVKARIEAERSLEMAMKESKKDLIDELNQHIEAYRKDEAYRIE